MTGDTAGNGERRPREEIEHHAWNPGLESEIPRRLRACVTVFQPGNGTLSRAEADELAGLTGLDPVALARFTPERLIVHELLVRVTADLSVPDGPNYEDLGINLRGMVATLFEQHVMPELDAIRERFARECERMARDIDDELAMFMPGPPPVRASMRTSARGPSGDAPGVLSAATASGAPGIEAADPPEATALEASFTRRLRRLFGRRRSSPVAPRSSAATSVESPELAAMSRWREALAADAAGAEARGDETTGDETTARRRACLDALLRTVGGIVAHRGRLLGDRELVARIALGLASNARGAELIGTLVAPLFARGIEREGYRLLPPRAEPVVMNVKGASASGKSTIRPRQRELAAKLGIAWEDFALISPDYWRKYLLDYASLGDDFRYAAMLTGRELEIIDRKLDAYMAAKAARGEMSHLLIDRFRFDSFTLEKDRTEDSRLLTRFGHRVFMFFMITPPAETVERAWVRGCKTGRYKAVSDLLYHNVEAFTGMPALFLFWVNAVDKDVRFEFLDNDVPEGTLPRTAAFGWNGSMTVLDVALLCAIDRYREVDLDARRAEEALLPRASDAPPPTDFLRRCAERVAELRFADPDTARVYARVEHGKLLWWDREYVARDDVGDEVRHVLDVLGRSEEPAAPADPTGHAPIDLAREHHVTVGRWGALAASGES